MTQEANSTTDNDGQEMPPATSAVHSSRNPFVVYKTLLGILDTSAIVAAFYLSYNLRNYFFHYRGGIYVATAIHIVMLVMLVFFALALFRQRKLYQQHAFSRSPAHLQTLIGAWTQFIAVFIVIAFLLRVQLFTEHRITTAIFFVLGGGLLYVGRFWVVPSIAPFFHGMEKYEYGVLLIGYSPAAVQNVNDVICTRPWKARIAGALTLQDEQDTSDAGCSILGTIDDLQSVVAAHSISEVFICTEQNDFPTMTAVLSALRPLAIPTRIAIHHFEVIKDKIPVLPELEHGFISFNTSAFTHVDRFLKVCLDYTLAGFGLVVTSPVLLGIACLIKWDSAGPALFRQKRIGKDNRAFNVFKFRSMRENTEQHHQEVVGALMDGNHDAVSEKSGRRGFYKAVDSHSVTRIGQLLRKSSLDELPQLINVLRGEMSLVGPRPEPAYQVELYAPWQRARHTVKPGVTGLWQAYGRSAVSHEDVTLMDIFYINNWSLALDLQILARTFFVVLTGHGAT